MANSYQPFVVFHIFSAVIFWVDLYDPLWDYSHKNRFPLVSVVKQKAITANHEVLWMKSLGEVCLVIRFY